MSDKKKILIIQPIHKAGIDLIKNNTNYDYEIIENIDDKDIKQKILECDGLSIRTANLSSELINISKKLKIISRHGVGYDNIDLKSSKEKNITLAITATANAVAVAEHVMFMLLNISKRKNMYDEAVKTGNFSNRNKLPKTIELWKKNILIAGFGRIGQSLIRRCKGFEMNVFVYDPFVSKDIIEELGGKKVEDLTEAVKSMDAISLHMPLNEKTKNIINYDLLKTMRKNCIIINAARGGMINENDLDKALNESLIFGAGLDVFETEPPKEDNPLLKNNKVFLSPHTAAFTDAVEAKANLVKENHKKVVDFINGEINNCGNNDEGKFTIWGDPCNGEWSSSKVVNYINKNLNIENPFSEDTKVKTDPDPRIKAEGKAGQSVEMGVIFVMSSNFLPDPGSEWVVGTCFKSPCVAAGNNELTSLYR